MKDHPQSQSIKQQTFEGDSILIRSMGQRHQQICSQDHDFEGRCLERIDERSQDLHGIHLGQRQQVFGGLRSTYHRPDHALFSDEE